MARTVVTESFDKCCAHISSILNDGIPGTNTDQLDKLGKHLFGRTFKGVFPADYELPSRGYFIVNRDPADKPGSHWLAVGDGVFYDSYDGLPSQVIGLLKQKLTLTGLNPVTRQSTLAQDCGERCLAFLICLAYFGRHRVLRDL